MNAKHGINAEYMGGSAMNMMESLPQLLSPFPLLLKPQRTLSPNPISISPPSSSSHKTHFRFSTRATLVPKNSPFLQNLGKTQLSIAAIQLLNSLPCSASEAAASASSNEQVSDRINLESILVSIDDFFNRYPFFVAGCTFIWLVVIPLTEEYLRKYKFTSAVNAFKKLKSDSNAQLLDIRDARSLASLGSPSLKIFNKSVVQVEYKKEDEDGFVKKVLEKYSEPANTRILVLDNSDDNSIKVAELLSKNGFKVAYAIKGGVKGKKGWLAIQDTLFPPSVHILSKKKKAKVSQKLKTNGGVIQQVEKIDQASTSVPVVESQRMEFGGGNKSTNSAPHVKISSTSSSSPYPNYPDLKPPSSPTPSKPQN